MSKFALERIKWICLFYIQWKRIPSSRATKRCHFLAFACFHPRDIKIEDCISQVNAYIVIRISCEYIRKRARCKASYSFICHCSCFSVNHINDSETFKVLNQMGSECIIIVV